MGFLGFKNLFLHPGGYITSPLHKTQGWEVGKNYHAYHGYTYDYLKEEYDGSGLHCETCGFHSYKRPEFLENYAHAFSFKNKPTLSAIIPLWCVVDNSGFVVEHELGYRASRSKLIYATRDIHNLLEWCDDSLSDHMPQELIDWCNLPESDPTEWKVFGDHYNVILHYIQNWLENGRDAYLVKPSIEEHQMDLFPRGWGRINE